MVPGQPAALTDASWRDRSIHRPRHAKQPKRNYERGAYPARRDDRAVFSVPLLFYCTIGRESPGRRYCYEQTDAAKEVDITVDSPRQVF